MSILINHLRCDYYNATFTNLDSVNMQTSFIYTKLLSLFSSAVGEPVIFVNDGKGFRGYPQSGRFVLSSDSSLVAIVAFGSDNPKMGIHCNVGGAYSHEFRLLLIEAMKNDGDFLHRCSRCDVALDFFPMVGFNSVYNRFKLFAARSGIKTNYQGDWDNADGGRTYYLGSSSAAIKMVLYEKGKEQLKSKDFVYTGNIESFKKLLRFEVRVSGAEGRGLVIPTSTLEEIFFSTRTVKNLFKYALPYIDLSKPATSLVYIQRRGKNSLDTLDYVLSTYNNSFITCLNENFNGNIDLLMDYIKKSILK